MEKVNLDQAKKEVNNWLDFKKVDQEKRDENSENIDSLAKAISLGYLSMDKDFNFIQELKFPMLDDDGSVSLGTLKFKPRLKMGEIQNKSQNLKTGDTFALITAYVCALTNVNSGIIKQMDSEDYKIAQSVVIFFL
tara:strand:- start:86 stop:493 length:408 start_codon:yes stop_codon:yes gene_type:complete